MPTGIAREPHSFALNIVDHITEAKVLNNGQLNNVNNLTLTATSTSTENTDARAGAKGGTAFAGALAIAVVTEDTFAQLGSGTPLTVGGNLSVTANHTVQ